MLISNLLGQSQNPELNPQAKYQTIRRKPGDAGIYQTVDIMRRIKEKYKIKPWIIELARQIVTDRNAVTEIDQMKAVFNWMKGTESKPNILYVKDPHDVELLQFPEVTIRTRTGDCDDHAILSSSLLEALGIPAKFRIVSYKPDRGFQHVYTIARSRGQWYPADTTLPGKPFGYEKSTYTRKEDH